MAKRLFSSESVVAFGSAVAAGYIRLVYNTSEVRRDPPDTDAKLFAEHPQIFAMWHGQFGMLPKIKPDRPADVAAMVARHGDAELIAGVLSRFGMRLIRGAGAGYRRRNRGGAAALRESLKALQQGTTVAMTADVAPGPARKAGNGIVMLAKLSGRPIVPCAMATNRYLTLSNWSAFTINLPFSKLGIVVGDPVRVPEDADSAALEAARIAVERGLNQATARAYELAGATDPLLPAVQVKDAPKPAFALRAYRALTRYAAPVAPLLLAWRTRIGKEEPARRPERYGEASVPRPSGFLVWFHAASVGEANAVLPVIDAIAAEHPEIGLLLTTGTVTSAKLARARLPKGAVHQYVPLDNQDYVRRFLKHWQPDLAVFVESEIWPNLVLETNALNVPLVLVNGRMSFRSFRRWRNRPGLSRPLFSAFGLVLAQNDRFAQRFTALGTPRTVAVGNLKADAPPPPVDLAGHKKLAAALAGRTVWLAASTHPGEDDIAAVAHLAMKKARPDLLTVIVPRHPERGPFIARLLEGANLKVALRSEGKLPEAGTDIYIADTIGELGLFYNLVPVALIGGSLVPHGGQNPVEAIKLGAAVVTGPHWRNFADAYEELLASGGAVQVSDAQSLATTALLLLENAQARGRIMSRAEGAIARLGGALPRTISELEQFLPPKATPQHAS
ncbi:MAG TPA: glycosyltransferase N-terminal domain-containing protein [Methyloceanibacter sp.]|jgi:3-deoxy-D-manno-octulosonic-acid transferase|nr:glycosyltransferase N-terminal domain-containing protein [Methyloceanibacter sp.]